MGPVEHPAPGAVWLPGDAELDVAGESYHVEAIRAAERAALRGTQLIGVLTPEPQNPHSPLTIAVYLSERLVGYVPRALSADLQPALLRFAAEHEGRVSAPASIRRHEFGYQVVLLLDPVPLGLPVDMFDLPSALARTVRRLLPRLAEPPAPEHPADPAVRDQLAQAEAERARLAEDFNRSPDALPQLEQRFQQIVTAVGEHGGPVASRAWCGLARTRRFQRGRRDDTLAAYVEALYRDPANAEAWAELVELISWSPHIATMIDLLERCPVEARPPVLRQYLTISEQRDRAGKMSARQGNRLRAGMLGLVTEQQDNASRMVLLEDQGTRAERAGELDEAVWAWREAVQAGSTSAAVADRLSIWLTKNGEHAEAVQVLRQALSTPPENAALRTRLEKRLARAQRAARHEAG